MEQLANKISQIIAKDQNLSEEKRQVIAYGLTAMIQMLCIFIIILIVGYFLHIQYEAIVIFITVGLLRKSTGGAHASTILGCLIFSCINILVLAFLSNRIIGLLPFVALIVCSLVTYGICMIIAYQKVPVDCKNKPITKPEKIKRLRTESFVKLSVCFVLAIALFLCSRTFLLLEGIAFSILLSMIWQIITLTKFGAKLISLVDL